MNPIHNNTTPEEIQAILTGPEPELQTSMSPDESPLNRPVAEKSSPEKPESSPFDFPEDEGPVDAPEQVIGNGAAGPGASPQQPEIPTDAAMIATETFLGMFNNVVTVGAGYFIRIEKKGSFYDLEGFTTVLDEQNKRNLEKIKLDEGDKALLRPLIAEMIRKHAIQLSVEKQLVGVLISILFKKAKLIMEIRNENQTMVQKVEALIKEGKLRQASSQMEPSQSVEESEVEPVEEVV